MEHSRPWSACPPAIAAAMLRPCDHDDFTGTRQWSTRPPSTRRSCRSRRCPARRACGVASKSSQASTPGSRPRTSRTSISRCQSSAPQACVCVGVCVPDACGARRPTRTAASTLRARAQVTSTGQTATAQVYPLRLAAVDNFLLTVRRLHRTALAAAGVETSGTQKVFTIHLTEQAAFKPGDEVRQGDAQGVLTARSARGQRRRAEALRMVRTSCAEAFLGVAEDFRGGSWTGCNPKLGEGRGGTRSFLFLPAVGLACTGMISPLTVPHRPQCGCSPVAHRRPWHQMA